MLQIGQYRVDPPVVLAPMAGITNVAFRRLCREFSSGAAGEQRVSGDSAAAGGLFVCEMVTTRALLERNPKTMRMVAFDQGEHPRSLQLYGVDPDVVGAAVRMVVHEGLADHIDLNFGCPVPKVTRKGGGSALPWRRRLFERIVRGAVDAAAPAGVPVTVKMRVGIDKDHLTYRVAGRIAQDAGVSAVALHARTAVQGYAGEADWAAIAALKQDLSIPVLGNGDIWEAADAVRMMEQTGADGVVVGRGCLGRPWLFADLAAAFAGRGARALPTLGDVAVVMRGHAEALVEWLGDERRGCADFRKHIAWYLKGFPVGGQQRSRLAMVSSLLELDDLLGAFDATTPFPVAELGAPRGRTSSPGRVVLPEGWLEDPDSDEVPRGAEVEVSGG
jgi:nifR3 family TIM-barrel protein